MKNEKRKMKNEKRNRGTPFLHFALFILRFSFCVLLLSPHRAFALDGFVITTRWTFNGPVVPEGRNYGDLVRYDLKDDKVVRVVTIYDGGDAGRAVIGPRGERVAFVRRDGTVAVVPAGGGAVRELLKAPAADHLQWPGGEGGRWVYYLDNDPQGRPRYLKRVSVADGVAEFVVAFNATPGVVALSQDVTRTSGHLVARTDEWPGVVGYDLVLGTGDLFGRMLDEGGYAPTLAPDGALFADVTTDRAALRVADWNGRPRKVVKAAEPRREALAAARWAVNAGDWVVAGIGRTSQGGPNWLVTSLDAVAFDWPRGRTVRITRNDAGTFDRSQGIWVEGGADAGLGNYEGEAPYRVTLAHDGMKGEWEWDFGDGTTETSAAGTHTYADPGLYDVTARQGDRVVEGRVNVLDRAAPRVAATHLLDGRHVLVEFDESVRGEGAKVDAAGGVSQWSLDPNGRLLTVELKEEPKAGVELSLAGFQDLAQAPNALAGGKVTVEPSDWPSRRNGLRFLWESAKAANVTYDVRQARPVFHRMLRDGQAMFDRHGSLRLDGGWFRAAGLRSEEPVAGGGREGVSLELTFRTADPNQFRNPLAGGVIVTVGSQFTIMQQGDRLIVEGMTRDGNRFTRMIAQLAGAEPHHLIVTHTPGHLVGYLDGNQVVVEANQAQGPLTVTGPLHVGDPELTWRGSVEGVAVYDRALSVEEIGHNFAAYRKRIDARPKVPRLEVEAKLVATSTVPTFASVAPYREALVVYEYEIVKTTKGEHEGKKLRVAHFGLVNAQPTTIAKAQVGATSRLVLEKFTDRPDLADTLLSDTLPEDFEAVLYVDAE